MAEEHLGRQVEAVWPQAGEGKNQKIQAPADLSFLQEKKKMHIDCMK